MTQIIAEWLFIVSFVVPPAAVAVGVLMVGVRKAVRHPEEAHDLPTAA